MLSIPFSYIIYSCIDLFITTNGLSTCKTFGEAHPTFLNLTFCAFMAVLTLCIHILHLVCSSVALCCHVALPFWAISGLFVDFLCLFVYFYIYIYIYSCPKTLPTSALVSHCITFTTLLLLLVALRSLKIVEILYRILRKGNSLTFMLGAGLTVKP